MKVKIKQAKRYVISLSEHEVVLLMEKLGLFTIESSGSCDNFCEDLHDELEELLNDSPVTDD